LHFTDFHQGISIDLLKKLANNYNILIYLNNIFRSILSGYISYA
jgi:hypothetical protein